MKELEQMVAIDMQDETRLFQLIYSYPMLFLGDNAIQVYQLHEGIYVDLSIIFQLVYSIICIIKSFN